ncbi:MAG: redoxin domain-containing protein, partial [Pseudomonadota bacterium]
MTFSRRLTLATLGAVAALSTSAAIANVTTNDAAPDFTGTATDGASVSLSDFAGKTVVLEWTNHGCPFV